jgi:hypothetical protein
VAQDSEQVDPMFLKGEVEGYEGRQMQKQGVRAEDLDEQK